MMEAFGPVAGQLALIEGHALNSAQALIVMRSAMDLAEAKTALDSWRFTPWTLARRSIWSRAQASNFRETALELPRRQSRRTHRNASSSA